MKQMMELLVAILEAFESKLMAKLDSLVSWVNAHQAKTEANHEELMAILKANQGRLRRPDRCQTRTDEGLSKSDRGQEQMEANIKTGLEEMKATQSEAVAEHQEVHNGQAALENRSGD
jgi:hypothetical protein